MLQRAASAIALLAFAYGSAKASVIAPNFPPDLSSAPPDVSVGVNPNIYVTFDDSGSMAQTVMGDFPPQKTATSNWSGPWRCSNVVDPDHRSSSTSDRTMRAIAMNGVYYNPNTTYAPPMKEDGSLFVAADATLAKVWVDGVAVSRPWNATTAATTATYENNTDVNGSSNDANIANLIGGLTTVSSGSSATCGSYSSSVCACSGSGSSKVCKADLRWQCGTGTTVQNSDSDYVLTYPNLSPMDGASHTLSDGTSVTYPNGGPYYYRYKLACGTSGAQASPNCGTAITLDAYGKFTSTSLTALYTASNWEAVPVPSSQYQNFANWYAYYRTRSQMARTALSRVFGVLGTPQKANIRVTWQNLGNNSTKNWPATTGTTSPTSQRIVELDDTTSFTTTDSSDSATGNNTWRQAFFNWIYNAKAGGSTPTRTALLRAGSFFQRGKSASAPLSDPYWQPQGAGGRELACRQNFHLMMTDGLYNSPTANPPTAFSTQSVQSLPSNPSGITQYKPTDAVSQLYAHATGSGAWTTDGDGSSSFSDIAFYYWATNLRPDFSTVGNANYTTDSVPSYFPDLSTGIATSSATVNPANPGATPEVFWNPVNDPATWPHLVQFAVTLGAFGNLVNSTNTDCQNSATTSNDDGCALRKGVANSSGSIGWPKPNGTGSGIPPNIDDLWHAALDSRGQFFVATNPQTLINRLTKIISNIIARSGSSVSESVNSSILNQGSVAYQGGYNSSGWVGYLYKQNLDPNTGAPLGSPSWDAGCLLTGGVCVATGSTVTAQSPSNRKLFTSTGWPNTLTGVPFQWASLGTNEQLAMNLDPTSTWPDTTTGAIVNASTGVPNGTQDANGQSRISYLRGVRTNETVATSSSTNPTIFRPRTSVLGAIIDSQAIYEGAPSAGWQDIYPIGSPEQVAAASGTTYEAFVHNNLTRNPMVYVGANDGMLHAFDAASGSEVWGYVPNTLYANGQLVQMTNPANGGLVVSVDDSPTTQDVFIGGAWKTVLVGGLRLGGRGVYMLDVTDTSAPASESAAASKFKWEFTSTQDPDLGYSYATANIARLHCNRAPCHGLATASAPVGGTWVVLVTSGNFPVCLPAGNGSATCVANSHSATDTANGATAAANAKTYLWVLNADDGSLIAKIPTKTGYTSYGLSTPSVVDFGSDQVDDVAVAGDLAGNLWRFDLSDPDPTKWAAKTDLMFQTYGNTSPCGTSNVNGLGCEPITVMPVAFPDSVTGSVVWVFGSGQYLGATDNSTSSTPQTQHFFGIRDYGTGSTNYPIQEGNLNVRLLTQDSSGVRSLPYAATTVTNSRGWMIPLNVSGVLGERDVATASPLYSAGVALLTSLIPGQNNDPCIPGRSGAVMAIDASSGGPPLSPAPTSASATSATVGFTVSNPPAVGGLSLISMLGGGKVILPGMQGTGGTPPQFNGLTPIWRRSSWNELLNQM